MGVPTSEVGYTSATSRREDHEVHKGHVVALGGGEVLVYHYTYKTFLFSDNDIMGQDISAHLSREYTNLNNTKRAYLTQNTGFSSRITEKLSRFLIFKYLKT